MLRFLSLSWLSILLACNAAAFAPQQSSTCNPWSSRGEKVLIPLLTWQRARCHPLRRPKHFVQATRSNSSNKKSSSSSDEPNFLLQDFKTASGEILNPYETLKLKRTATSYEIKQAYYTLSRRYHPDGMRHRDILPGNCNNLDEVRDTWERIKLSYEILKSPKLRKRYDRHEVLADPGAAMKRAAVDAAVSGIQGVGKSIGQGIWGMGAFAVNHIKKTSQDLQQSRIKELKEVEQQQQKQSQERKAINKNNIAEISEMGTDSDSQSASAAPTNIQSQTTDEQSKPTLINNSTATSMSAQNAKN